MVKVREFKFRAWDTQKKKFDYDVMILRGEACYIDSFDSLEFYKEGRMVIQQYTGLKDRNGKEIFEGDIVKGKRFSGKGEHVRFIGEVVFVIGCFKINGVGQYKGILHEDLHGAFEVIGNIYDNPELIQK